MAKEPTSIDREAEDTKVLVEVKWHSGPPRKHLSSLFMFDNPTRRELEVGSGEQAPLERKCPSQDKLQGWSVVADCQRVGRCHWSACAKLTPEFDMTNPVSASEAVSLEGKLGRRLLQETLGDDLHFPRAPTMRDALATRLACLHC
jgi:hypothetical protein